MRTEHRSGVQRCHQQIHRKAVRQEGLGRQQRQAASVVSATLRRTPTRQATTKTRIVFDASATTDGVSLNALLHAGPKLQRDLVEVLVRFREKPVAIVCDISEMYLQVSLAPEVRPYHRFLWRDLDSSRPPDVYEFQRVVFGVNASPFLAQYITQQHAHANDATLPLAADAVLSSTYMDDTMTSVGRQPYRPPTIQRDHDTVAESRDARQEVAVQLDRRPRCHPANRPSGTTRPERRQVTTVSQETRLAVELRNR